MNESEEALMGIGLTRTEAKIYLTGLASDALTIQDIAHKTKIKRPTIYHAINTLTEKGLVSEKKRGNKTQFTMCPPEMIRGLVERQREALEERAKKLDDLIPLLAQQTRSEGDDTSVVQYSGIEGMKLVMDIAFYCHSKKWDIIAPYQNFLREYDRDYAERYLSARKHYGITSRTLWEDGMRTNKKLTAEEKRERNPRLMPWVMHGKFKSMIFLFDDKIAIFSSFEKPSAILITSRELKAMFQALFDGLWDASEGY
ncbi:MAG: hypothetical protein KBD06_04365 [Candidatus Pacebacteria bacterium]|nr:hypothetical protein [Candidatus Paceibacterota bacterium]